MQAEAHVLKDAFASEPFQPQKLSARRLAGGQNFHLIQLAPHHHANDLVLVGLAGEPGSDIFPVPQHCDPVGDLENLFQVVRHKNDRNPALLELAQELEKDIGFLNESGGGWLIPGSGFWHWPTRL